MRTEDIKTIKKVLLEYSIHPTRKKFFLVENGYKSYERTEQIEEDLYIDLLNGRVGVLPALDPKIKGFILDFNEKRGIFVFYAYIKSQTAYVKDLPSPDRLFNCEIVSHGLAAYTQKKKGDVQIVQNLRNILRSINYSTMEICAAHKSQHIGPVGIYVMGDMKFVSNIDLCSAYDGVGRYVYRHYWRIAGVFSKTQINLCRHSHMEYIVTPKKICGIWYKEGEVSKDLLLKLEEIARAIKVNLYKVK